MSIPVYDWLRFQAGAVPNKLATVDVDTGRRQTYGALDERVTRLANALTGRYEIKKGDRVAVLAPNSVDQMEIMFAAQRTGFIFLPLNWRLAVPELEYICRDSEPVLLVYHASMRETALEVAKRAGVTVTLEMADSAPSAFELAIAAAPTTPLQPPGLTHDDPWSIIYTSGTTGRPKGALLTHGQMLYNAIHAAAHVGLTPQSAGLTFLPMFHVGGICVYVAPLVHFGGTNYIMRGFDAAKALQLFADKSAGITHGFAVPTNLIMIEQLPEFGRADFSHLVSVGIGGAAPSPTLLATYNAKGMNLQHVWGMTETATLGTVLAPDKAVEKLGSAGRAVLHAELRIVDAVGKVAGPGEVGELQIRGPTVTPGYWRKPEANAASFVAGGWFRTGDAAVSDAEGYYSIVDRWKDMYISGGENVYPAEIENVLYQMNAIGECAVIGIPHDKWGEVGRAFIVLKAGATTTAEAIQAHCRSQLARFKVPAEVRFVAELPHNATGKVTKHALPKD